MYINTYVCIYRSEYLYTDQCKILAGKTLANQGFQTFGQEKFGKCSKPVLLAGENFGKSEDELRKTDIIGFWLLNIILNADFDG